jgi:TRAP-type mannitol/chloroaromatic compound transport system permease large subunit
MGAVGALVLAGFKGKLNLSLTRQALESTAKLSTFVMFILIGSTVFSFTFNAADGHIWVEHLFENIPGGALGFLIVVNLLIFVLGMFIDFFEIAFIVVPLLAPAAAKILPELVPGMTSDQALIWFGVMVAMNLQTSFLTPPFGFALFYLRSVAARNDYTDRVTGQNIPSVKTTEIYKGSIAFIALQLLMVPSMVTGSLTNTSAVDLDSVTLEASDSAFDDPDSEEGDKASTDLQADEAKEEAAEDDPMKDIPGAGKR